MNNLFQIRSNYGKGKRIGGYYDNKMAAKADRTVMNGGKDKEIEGDYYHRVCVAPDHWRWVK